jgi:formylglycine-generating enzyme required for sulfatase activity
MTSKFRLVMLSGFYRYGQGIMSSSEVFLFVSHVNEDSAAALEIVGKLEQRGLRCWIAPRDVRPGSRFDDEIADALDACRAMLLIFSKKCNESEYIRREVTFAGESGKDIIPIRIEKDARPLRGLRVRLSTLHWIDGSISHEHVIDELARNFVAPASELEQREWCTEEAERPMRAEGRVLVEAAIVQNAKGKWFLPGAGRAEWFKDHEAGPEMVVVPAGKFMMGSPDTEPQREGWQGCTESPRHEVTIATPFAVARHAITRGQFAAFASATSYKTEGGATVFKGDKWKRDPKASWRAPGFLQDDSHPVVCVNRDDAKTYAAWLSQTTGKPYCLLSEAEREYVTRAGTTTPFWWGPSITPDRANYRFVYEGGGSKGEWRKSTAPVGIFEANPWGLYNVHGNVWEWCEDVWNDNYSGAPVDGSAWLQGGDESRRVVRGGSWDGLPQNLRAALRLRYSAVYRDGLIGFRLARTLSP